MSPRRYAQSSCLITTCSFLVSASWSEDLVRHPGALSKDYHEEYHGHGCDRPRVPGHERFALVVTRLGFSLQVRHECVVRLVLLYLSIFR